ncbi:MAG: hypothetical protein AAFP70_10875 [Calditrichota bacterium]
MATAPYTSTHTLIPSEPFDFHETVTSHGWYVLKPNFWDSEKSVFSRVEQLSNGTVVCWRVHHAANSSDPQIHIEIDSAIELTNDQCKEVLGCIRYMFRMDEDLTGFYQRCTIAGGRWKKLANGSGRLLRSPTLFEDLVKTICTTNVHWSGTIRMVAGLVDELGKPLAWDENLKAFPTFSEILSAEKGLFENTVKLGYRAAYVLEIASIIQNGLLDLEALRYSELPTEELRQRLMGLKGIGKYGAAILLMFMERYDDLPVDSVFRDFVTKEYFDGRNVSEAKMREVYLGWAEWSFLAFWFDMWGNEE